MSLHSNQTYNHPIENWVYPNAAARTGATGFVTADIGKIAYQTDTGQYWRLTATTPVWQGLVAVTYASVQTTQGTPAGTTSTSGVMMGLGTSINAKITPTASGKVLFNISGRLANNTLNFVTSATLYYGTGTPPANGAAATGTQISTTALATLPANVQVPYSLQAIVTGLVVGTQYWFDLALSTTSGGTATAVTAQGSAVELP